MDARVGPAVRPIWIRTSPCADSLRERLDTRETLLRSITVVTSRKSKAQASLRRSFDAVRIGDAPPQHLIAAAQAEHCPPRQMCAQVRYPMPCARRKSRSPRLISSGKDDERGSPGMARRARP